MKYLIVFIALLIIACVTEPIVTENLDINSNQKEKSGYLNIPFCSSAVDYFISSGKSVEMESGSGGQVYFIAPAGSLSINLGGGSCSFFVAKGASFSLSGGGGGNSVYVENGASASFSSSGGNTLYYESGAEISGLTGIEVFSVREVVGIAFAPCVADSLEPTVSFISSSTVTESESGVVLVKARLSEPTDKDVVIPFTVSESHSLTSEDYAISDSVIVIPAGKTEGYVEVTIVEDSKIEESYSQTFSLIMKPSSEATVWGITTHTIRITDDDVL